MATNPTHSEPSRNWPSRGEAMSEEEYHELERLNPDRKYEYIDVHIEIEELYRGLDFALSMQELADEDQL